jgi:hypothetical protein
VIDIHIDEHPEISLSTRDHLSLEHHRQSTLRFLRVTGHAAPLLGLCTLAAGGIRARPLSNLSSPHCNDGQFDSAGSLSSYHLWSSQQRLPTSSVLAICFVAASAADSCFTIFTTCNPPLFSATRAAPTTRPLLVPSFRRHPSAASSSGGHGRPK